MTAPGTPDEPRPHDFRRSKSLDRVHLHTMCTVLEGFARLAGAPLSTELRQQCSLALADLDQVTGADLMASLDSDLHFLVFSLEPAPGQVMVALPTPEALALVDLRLAGSGDEVYPDRALTEIEEELLAPVVEHLMAELARAFARLQTLVPALLMQESHAQFVTVAAPGETCLAARFTVTIGDRPGFPLHLSMPLSTVQHLADALPTNPGPSGGERAATLAAAVHRRLREVPVELVLQFPSITTTPSALMTLAVGDEIHLGLPLDRPLEVRSEGHLVARATIGRSGARKAGSITEEVLT